MKLYKMNFHDLEHGTVVAWHSSKKNCAALKRKWRKEFPQRALVLTERIDVPTGRAGFVQWLNENATR